jgi:hypothetical protein
LATPTEPDLLIDIWPRGQVHYSGSMQQLREEGLLDDIELPAGTVSKCWDCAGFDYYLRRARPPGLKGPKKLWADGNYWMLTVRLTKNRGGGFHAANVYEKQQALAKAVFDLSPEHAKQWNRWWIANKDDKFQALLSRVVPPKRGKAVP